MKDDFFTKKSCDRCSNSLAVRVLSKMNTDVICMKCNEEEKTHPKYKEACDREYEELQNGNYNYEGLFANQKYPFEV